jgi:rSAM/selenodomain-associated transferase 1
MAQPEALIVFLRLPVVGTVKTRIASTSNEEKALSIYRILLDYTFRVVSEVSIPVFLFYEGGLPPLTERDQRYMYHPQTEGTLATKMDHAFSIVLQTHQSAILIGSDCPTISASMIENSFQLLNKNDIVVGPATDGGFYLYGCKKHLPQLFEGIRWGTSSVLQQFLTNIQEAGLSYHLLRALSDIDTLEDWVQYTNGRHVSEDRKK